MTGPLILDHYHVGFTHALRHDQPFYPCEAGQIIIGTGGQLLYLFFYAD